MQDSISLGTSKLERDAQGFPRFKDTTADLRYVDKAITREDADKSTISTFMNADKELQFKIIDQQTNPENYSFLEERAKIIKMMKKTHGKE
jgi:hypothetical protein